MLNLNEPVSHVKPAIIHASATYPPNRSGWLHKFSSILARAEVAREIGRDATFLILAIAIQEDAQQYQSAPIYFDSELQRVTGIRSRKQLDRIRQKAVDAGWLVVALGVEGDQSVARYWTVIPSRLNVFHDAPDAAVTSGQAVAQSQDGAILNDTNSARPRLSDNVEAPRPAILQASTASPSFPVAAVVKPEPSVETRAVKMAEASNPLNSKMPPATALAQPAVQPAGTESSPSNVMTGTGSGSKTTATSQANRGPNSGSAIPVRFKNRS